MGALRTQLRHLRRFGEVVALALVAGPRFSGRGVHYVARLTYLRSTEKPSAGESRKLRRVARRASYGFVPRSVLPRSLCGSIDSSCHRGPLRFPAANSSPTALSALT